MTPPCLFCWPTCRNSWLCYLKTCFRAYRARFKPTTASLPVTELPVAREPHSNAWPALGDRGARPQMAARSKVHPELSTPRSELWWCFNAQARFTIESLPWQKPLQSAEQLSLAPCCPGPRQVFGVGELCVLSGQHPTRSVLPRRCEHSAKALSQSKVSPRASVCGRGGLLGSCLGGDLSVQGTEGRGRGLALCQTVPLRSRPWPSRYRGEPVEEF